MHPLLHPLIHQSADEDSAGESTSALSRYIVGASLVAGVLLLSCVLKFCRKAVVPFVKRRLCGIDPSPIPPPPITVRERYPTDPHHASQTSAFIKQIPELKLQNEDDRRDDCPICMDTLGHQLVSSGPCKHYFHSVCLKSWLVVDGKMHCPVCRMGVHPTSRQSDTPETIQTTRGTQTTQRSSPVERPPPSASAPSTHPANQLIETADASAAASSTTSPTDTASPAAAPAATTTTTATTLTFERPSIAQSAPT